MSSSCTSIEHIDREKSENEKSKSVLKSRLNQKATKMKENRLKQSRSPITDHNNNELNYSPNNKLPSEPIPKVYVPPSLPQQIPPEQLKRKSSGSSTSSRTSQPANQPQKNRTPSKQPQHDQKQARSDSVSYAQVSGSTAAFLPLTNGDEPKNPTTAAVTNGGAKSYSSVLNARAAQNATKTRDSEPSGYPFVCLPPQQPLPESRGSTPTAGAPSNTPSGSRPPRVPNEKLNYYYAFKPNGGTVDITDLPGWDRIKDQVGDPDKTENVLEKHDFTTDKIAESAHQPPLAPSSPSSESMKSRLLNARSAPSFTPRRAEKRRQSGHCRAVYTEPDTEQHSYANDGIYGSPPEMLSHVQSMDGIYYNNFLPEQSSGILQTLPQMDGAGYANLMEHVVAGGDAGDRLPTVEDLQQQYKETFQTWTARFSEVYNQLRQNHASAQQSSFNNTRLAATATEFVPANSPPRPPTTNEKTITAVSDIRASTPPQPQKITDQEPQTPFSKPVMTCTTDTRKQEKSVVHRQLSVESSESVASIQSDSKPSQLHNASISANPDDREGDSLRSQQFSNKKSHEEMSLLKPTEGKQPLNSQLSNGRSRRKLGPLKSASFPCIEEVETDTDTRQRSHSGTASTLDRASSSTVGEIVLNKRGVIELSVMTTDKDISGPASQASKTSDGQSFHTASMSSNVPNIATSETTIKPTTLPPNAEVHSAAPVAFPPHLYDLGALILDQSAQAARAYLTNQQQLPNLPTSNSGFVTGADGSIAVQQQYFHPPEFGSMGHEYYSLYAGQQSRLGMGVEAMAGGNSHINHQPTANTSNIILPFPQPQSVIIDTDGCTDAALALLMALKHAQVTVKAITCVAGRTTLQNTTANVLRTMKAAHTPHQPTDKIPVFAGCAHSLIKPFTTQRLKSHTSTSQGSMSRTESHDDGFGNRAYDVEPSRPNELEIKQRLSAEHAAVAISNISKSNKSRADGKVAVVALGPLTNLATAVTLDPDLPTRISKLVLLGGSLYGMNSTTCSDGRGEFNFACDPEAAKIVLDAFSPRTPIQVVTYESCKQNPITFDKVPELQSSATSFPEFSSLLFPEEIYNQGAEIPSLFPIGYTCQQAYAMAVAILNSEVILSAERHPVTIELSSTAATRGSLVIYRNKSAANPLGQAYYYNQSGLLVQLPHNSHQQDNSSTTSRTPPVQLPTQFNLEYIEGLIRIALA